MTIFATMTRPYWVVKSSSRWTRSSALMKPEIATAMMQNSAKVL